MRGMLDWEELFDGSSYRAPAPLFGWIRVEGWARREWTVNWSVPGTSNTLVKGTWPTSDEAKQAAEIHVRDALDAYASKPNF